jgi:uncharacterized protein YjbJ (UPF0337 family)
MINAQILQGQWNEIKGILKQHWGDLTADDLRRFNGDVDQLVGLIQRKTGETRRAIQDYLASLTADASSDISTAVENGRTFVNDAASAAQGTLHDVADHLRDHYGDAADVVRGRPAESVVAAFGVGLVTGLVLSLFMRDR